MSGSNNTSEGGLSVTCSMTDFSLKFYNRLAIRNQMDPRVFYNDISRKFHFFSACKYYFLFYGMGSLIINKYNYLDDRMIIF